MPTVSTVMSELKKLGTAQNVKVYRRHGATGELCGVSFANLGKLKKRIQSDHQLAKALWETGIMDARLLATMIAEPDKLTVTELNDWVKELDCYIIADAFSGMVSRSKYAGGRIDKWMKSKKEFIKATGYSVLASLLKDGYELKKGTGSTYLQSIEKEIHTSPNRARYSMNTALIAIGAYCPELTEAAIKTAKRIGPVEVDHGETSCQTPDAVSYIEKTVGYNASKKKR